MREELRIKKQKLKINPPLLVQDGDENRGQLVALVAKVRGFPR
jgi:hypothetical protein